jgi:C4-type Zn-finger protein
MSKRLVQQLEKAKEEHAKKVTNIEQEIECPRCHDVMTLHSEFDRLGYFCEECDFSLYLCVEIGAIFEAVYV